MTFEAHTLARTENPETSHAAARTVRQFAADHHDRIVAVLRQHPAGLTVHEIAAFCSLDAHAIGKRMNELERADRAAVVINLFGEVTRTSPSGRQARVWRAI